jgi:hypothetical protein
LLDTKERFASAAAAEAVLLWSIRTLVLGVRAMLSSLLGISTAALFGVSGLVLVADVRADVAITVVALSLNAMLFSLMVLGSLTAEAEA